MTSMPGWSKAAPDPGTPRHSAHVHRRRNGTAMRMRGAVLEAIGAPVVVDTLDLAPPRAGEVLLRCSDSG